MSRILWFLPMCLVLILCLIVQDRARLVEVIPSGPETALTKPSYSLPLWELGKNREQFAAVLAMSPSAGVLAISPPTGFPACVPWSPLYQIGNEQRLSLEKIIDEQPMKFLQMCLDRYDREVKGYTVVFRKQERIRGKLQNQEEIQVSFREKPFSVFFDWKKGAGLASKVLYVDGENNGHMLVRSFIVWTKDPDGAEAKGTSHYTIKQFGMKQALERTLASMHRAKARGELHLKYLGEFRVPQLGNRPCYKFVRTPYSPPEEEGLNELVFYIDQEHWLQAGSVLKDAHGAIISEYFFSDIKMNPEYSKDQFSRSGL